MTLSERQLGIVRRAQQRLQEKLGHWAQFGVCLHATHFLMEELHAAGIKARVQAGSMSWPIVPEGQDDGVSPTHFTYQWSPQTVASRLAMVTGNLPEMHVWVGLPDEPAIVDLSTGGLRQQCERLGVVWRAPDPPEFIWSPDPWAEHRAIYTPEKKAIGLAVRCLWEEYQPDYLAGPEVVFEESTECSQ